MQQDSAKLGRSLREYMRERGFTQTDIADKADVDQATVSRFLKKPPQRASGANQRLCNYAESVLSEAAENGDRAAAQRALEVCWDISEAHARAASKILDALAELSRHSGEERVKSG